MRKWFFTSESVTEGHPDKVCDQISDAIVDAALAQDPMARVACEAAVKENDLWLFGEITTSAKVNYEAVARDVIERIGYTEDCGFSAASCQIRQELREQSSDIAQGVDRAYENRMGLGNDEQLGAGDQGMMFGFACDETPELMPLPISLAHRLCRALTSVRKNGQLPYLRPDGKAQVTVEYHDGHPARIDTVVVSTQHSPDVDITTLRHNIREQVILKNLPVHLIDRNTKYLINPSGRFVIGGPVGDSGLTGRKIIVDTYGGYARHGGGCFSGKDPTKVDRSAAYMARYIAKNIVAAGLASKCEVQMAYAIGVAQPVSLLVETFGTAVTDPAIIEKAVLNHFDLRPSAIIKRLDLRRPIFQNLAAYGHVGREELGVAWELTLSAASLKAAALGS